MADAIETRKINNVESLKEKKKEAATAKEAGSGVPVNLHPYSNPKGACI